MLKAQPIYDLAVAWRIYPKISKKPLIFSDDKFKLVKVCLKSFRLSCANLKVKYFFILDGCPPSYESFIHEEFAAESIEIIKTDSIGNLATFKLQIDILTNQTDSEIVYFAEDDYLYQPNQFIKMVEIIKQKNLTDFASCYYHADIDKHPIHKHRKKTITFSNHTWLYDSSTCLTFITSKKNLQSARNILMTYANGNNDCAMWLVMTKTHIYNPFKYIKFYFTNLESYNILKTGVKYSFKYFFTFKKYKLLIASPAIGTHLEKELVSPDIDWLKIASEL